MTTLPPVQGIFRGQRGSRRLTAGLVLIVLALVVFVVGLVGIALLDAEIARRELARTTSAVELDDLRPARALLALMGFVPAILLFVATTLIIPGEMKRRGGWATRETTFWRGGTNAMIYRTVSVRVHAIWATVVVVAALLLVAVPGATAALAGWPQDRSALAWISLTSTGVLMTAAACVFVASLVKKVFWERAGRPDIETVGASTSQRFWRWLTYRWHLDTLLAAVGGLLASYCAFEAYRDSVEDWAGGMTLGVAAFVLGVVFSANFWRSGEDLGTQESVS